MYWTTCFHYVYIHHDMVYVHNTLGRGSVYIAQFKNICTRAMYDTKHILTVHKTFVKHVKDNTKDSIYLFDT